MRRRPTRHTRTAVLASAVAAVVSLLPLTGTTAAADTNAPGAPAHGGTALFAEPDKALGDGWEDSSDIAVQGVGDSAGFHIMAAKESDGFAFKEVARLTRKGLDVGPSTGYACVTGSGRYAAAVYAPSLSNNDPEAVAHGAYAAVVRLSDGKITEVTQGVQLSYFSPGCGDGDRTLFTSSDMTDLGTGGTTVIAADAVSGKVVSTRKFPGQLTHPLPTAHGDFGVLGGKLVELSGAGATAEATPQTKLPGPVFALAPSAGGAIDVGTVQKKKSVLTRWDGGRLARLGAAPVGKVKLFARKGGDLVAGDVKGIDTAAAPGLTKRTVADRPLAASREGHLVTTSMASAQMKGIVSTLGSPSDEGVGRIDIKATATETNTAASSQVATGSAVPSSAPDAPVAGAAATVTAVRDDDEPRNCGEGGLEQNCLAAMGAEVTGTIDAMEYPCIVKRGDPKRQALQPSANLVEWAVDQAVHGRLTTQRPAGWHDLGLPAFSPQGLFAEPSLDGGGTIPAQVMLGILAQESNFKQASWHSMYGTSGNTLQPDWFGNGASIHYYPNRAKGDCGYGIGQVTTGMSETGDFQFSTIEAAAIATDYATNIAAGLQNLSGKWNQLADLGMHVNNGESKYLENWFMALWGYNSGVYTEPTAENNGHVGLGWFNNPANPQYPPDRAGFLRLSGDDASHPADWSYPEKVLGWAEHPQHTWNDEASYTEPDMPDLGYLSLPDPWAFCFTDINNCTPEAADPCPAQDSSCWFHGSSTWIPGQNDDNSSTEKLSYSLGSGEPELQRMYPTGPCIDFPRDDSRAWVIDDLAEHEDTYGCSDFEAADSGKFSMQFGDNITTGRADGTVRATPYIAQIDVHQLGAGYDGHSFFTHSYPTGDFFHKVTARWEPNPAKLPPADQPGGQEMDVWVHLPNHGAEGIVKYSLVPGMNNDGAVTHSCRLNQATRSNGDDVWIELGSQPFWKGGRVEADNEHDSGTGDTNVAFDAVAFTYTVVPEPGVCGFG